jgi:hypothetical protein
MKANIIVTQGSYGFGYEWTLECETKTIKKNFYLGQDVKFCERVLGMDPADVITAIGTNQLNTNTKTKKLAKFIVEKLGLNVKSIKKLEAWELCCQ